MITRPSSSRSGSSPRVMQLPLLRSALARVRRVRRPETPAERLGCRSGRSRHPSRGRGPQRSLGDGGGGDALSERERPVRDGARNMRDRVSDRELVATRCVRWPNDSGAERRASIWRARGGWGRGHARKCRPGIARVRDLKAGGGHASAGEQGGGGGKKRAEACGFEDVVPDDRDGAVSPQRAAPIDDVIGAAGGAWTGEVQTGQSVGFVGASIFRGCPWGMSCTAIVSAWAVPLLRSVCSSLPPASMNPCPAV